MRTRKISVPKMTIGKHAKKLTKVNIKPMAPREEYRHSRPHVSKKPMGPRLPKGATLI